MLFYGIICINNGSLWLFSSGTGGKMPDIRYSEKSLNMHNIKFVIKDSE